MATTGTTIDTVNAPTPGAPSECAIVRVGVVVIVGGGGGGRRGGVEEVGRDGGLGMGSIICC